MVKTCWRVQYITGKRPSGVDDADLPWRDTTAEYDDEGTAWRAADECDAECEGRYTHRAAPFTVEIEIEPKPAAKPPAKAKPAAKRMTKTPIRCDAPRPMPERPQVNRQLREYRAQESFKKCMLMLEDDIARGYALDALDLVALLCETHLREAGSSVLTRRWRTELDALKAQIRGTSALRVVK